MENDPSQSLLRDADRRDPHRASETLARPVYDRDGLFSDGSFSYSFGEAGLMEGIWPETIRWALAERL